MTRARAVELAKLALDDRNRLKYPLLVKQLALAVLDLNKECDHLRVDLEYQTNARLQDARDSRANFQEWKKEKHDPLKERFSVLELENAARYLAGHDIFPKKDGKIVKVGED